MAAGRDEVAGYGGRPRRAAPSPRSGPSTTAASSVALADGRALSARRVLVTTGLRDELPDLPGVRERWGRDLLHCPYCHGHEVRDQRLGVLGGTPDAVQHALLIRQWSDDVVFFSHTSTPTANEREQLVARAIGIVDGPVGRLVVEDDRLHGVELEDGRIVRRDAVFVRPAFTPNSDLLAGLGCDTHENGWVVADPTGRTTRARCLGGGERRQPAGPGHHRRRRGFRGRHRDQRRPGRGGRADRCHDFRAGLPA